MLRDALLVLRCQGPRWLAFRGWYGLKQRVGWFQRTLPCVGWRDPPTGMLSRPVGLGAGSTSANSCAAVARAAVARAERILDGTLTWFSTHDFRVGFPPPWFQSPWSEEPASPSGQHWSSLDEFAAGDIKEVWEQSRFGAVFPLVRAFSMTGDPRYAEAFWRFFESWRQANPPQRGPHWKCGQEVALRSMALVFGFLVVRDEAATTAEREAKLAEVVAVSGRRIEANLGYALSQKNNHGISEAAGLFTAGIMLERPAWIDKGRRLLHRLATELIYEDGSFSQHSTNYHRLMLHVFLWAIRLGEVGGYPLSSQTLDRVARAGRWLWALMDGSTGRVFNLGANDGAHFLDLTELGYRDYRPTVQAVARVVERSAWLPPGPWDELAAWLGGDLAPPAGPSAPPASQYYDVGGYALFRDKENLALLRCPRRFRHRPGHCDLLHFDLMFRGVNVLRDGGSYSYNCEPRWRDYFSGTASHNTIQFDDHEQMPRVSRFLFGDWPDLRVEDQLAAATPKVVAEYIDWKGCWHRRAVTRTVDGFRIVDGIRGYQREATLRWRLAPEWKWTLAKGECESTACTIRVAAHPGPAACRLTTGWESLHYRERQELPVLEARVSGVSQELITDVIFR